MSVLTAMLRTVTNRAPDNLPELSRPHLLAGLLGLALAFAKVSTSRAAMTACPNEQLREESDINPASGQPYSVGLPDCRAYELVSSAQEDNDAMGDSTTTDYALASGDGDSLVWETSPAWSSAQPSNGTRDVLKATRGTVGWSSPLTLAPPGVNGRETFSLAAATADLSTVVLRAKAVPVFEDTVEHTILGSPSSLVESHAGGCCVTVATGLPTFGSEPVDLSADGSHVFFQTHGRLLPEDQHGPISSIIGEPETSQVYEWTQAGGLHLAGVDSEGKATSPCGAALVDEGHGVSADGSRVIFRSPDESAEQNRPEECNLGPVLEPMNSTRKLFVSDLYVRENGATTIDISKPRPGVPDYGASFVGATPDGSKVFFVSESALTPDKTNSGSGYADLYEYDVETGVLTRISAGHEEADVTALGGTLSHSTIVSADGSHVYFTALGQLVAGAGRTKQENINSCSPDRTKCAANLYVYADGRISFIANIERATGTSVHPSYSEAETEAPLSLLVAAVTSDGSDLVFDSKSRLTSYENQGHGELYRYDAASSTISCVSCSPTGAPAEGLIYFHATYPVLGGAEAADSVERLGGLSSDGSTVFFASSGQLLPAAANAAEVERKFSGAKSGGTPPADVYEWRDGVLSLISTGTSASADRLIGASPNGSDVFFASADALVGQDGEHSYHIYDARMEGGFPAPSSPVPCVSLATCRSMTAAPPATVAPASVNVSGPGNVTTITGSESPLPPARPKVESRSEKLKKALKACKKLKGGTRKSCEKTANRRYASKSKQKK